MTVENNIMNHKRGTNGTKKRRQIFKHRNEESLNTGREALALGTRVAATALGHLSHGFAYSTRGYRPSYPRQWVPNGFLRKNLEIKKKGYYISIKELVLGIMKHIRAYRNRILRLKDHLKRQYGRNERF
jgi:hypothetical protein